MFVDWAGQTVPIVDRETGETRPAYLFVAVLGASNYTYAEASLTQDLPSWIAAHCRALAFIGGVPLLIIPDNTKTAVVKPDYYEPDVNAIYQEMAEHYGTMILPARARKPKDKPKAEKGVQFLENWLLATLRNRTFFSLFELNQTLRLSLDNLNERPFQKLEGSRKTLFEALDKPALKPLPPMHYEFAYWKKAKVNIDCHIQMENNFYSVPYKLVRKQVDVRITATILEVFFKGERVCSHPLCHGRGRYATDSRHFSPAHRSYLEWTPEGSSTGPKMSVPIPPIWCGASWKRESIPSRATAPASASSVWPNATRRKGLRLRAIGHLSPEHAPTRASTPF
ncbi:Integrase core domain protein [Pelotomaculum schinkii]|uniref:Integrase core domain protein n=1 Tax=Pelotomaculum schinkii TaxID=78350 RepID=A0A4Y7RIA7_9FIRM|nr:Integrase core domain protein [Pelotomaculum schinkii]